MSLLNVYVDISKNQLNYNNNYCNKKYLIATKSI